jgi:hypothetical protein
MIEAAGERRGRYHWFCLACYVFPKSILLENNQPLNRSVHHVGVDLILPQQCKRLSRDA